MAVHSPLNAFDILLIEIGQEIKLLEHLKKKIGSPCVIPRVVQIMSIIFQTGHECQLCLGITPRVR
jgi:hypothetical protein